MSIRLLIADDHEAVRLGLVNLLAGTEVEIVAQAASGKECLKLAEQIKPDVILLDVRIPEGDGFQVLKKLRQKAPETKVVMLSHHDNPTYVARSVIWGASDYVLKGSGRQAILDAIVAAASGQGPTSTGELARMVKTLNNQEAVEDDRASLTRRETQLLRHLALGLSNNEIGRSLAISVETVKEHVQNVLRKLAVKDRTQAAVWAVRKGLV